MGTGARTYPIGQLTGYVVETRAGANWARLPASTAVRTIGATGRVAGDEAHQGRRSGCRRNGQRDHGVANAVLGPEIPLPTSLVLVADEAGLWRWAAAPSVP